MARKGKETKEQQTPETKEAPLKRKPRVQSTAIKQAEAGETFPVVGIGASAGGLEALGHFLSHMPENSGMAFIVVQHLDPTHISTMPDLLRKYTGMPVLEAKDGAKVEPNHVYVIPPNRNMTIMHRTLQLLEQPFRPGLAHSIDLFFRSLAEDLKERAVCVVLSGTGTDGALGAKAVKAELGLVMVQDPETARYDGMPRAAVETGVADFVLPAEQMAAQLTAYVRQSYGKPAARRHRAVEKSTTELQKVLALVRTRTKHDFSGYKIPTINRRIARRMSINQIDEIRDYVRLLQEDPKEIDALFKDFLINVTSFFRDPEAFAILKEKLKDQLKAREEGSLFRVWILGCSTGEEAYSVAIILEECREELEKYLDVQIFGTDIDRDAIALARGGIYSPSIATDVSEERLKRFFVRKDGQYQIKKEIREKLVFAVQDVIKDPPFSRMDLITVRNLLIYLGSELQKKVIPIFHYALNNGGILFLGTAESLGESSGLFQALDSKWRIYQRKPQAGPLPPLVPEARTWRDATMPALGELHAVPRQPLVPQTAERALLLALPPAVLVDDGFRIIYVHGETSRYLELPQGQPTTNILDMARPGVRTALASALSQAMTDNQEVVRDGGRVKYNGQTELVRIRVKPATEQGRAGQFIVVFQEMGDIKARRRKGSSTELDARVKDLETELQHSRESLRSTVEELETANEELRSANEEYQSTNEELQSTNEELETSREELQSVNEELMTMNTEYQKKIEELYNINDDMKNFLNSTNIATIFLSEDLRIKRFTSTATGIFNIIDSDVGRPIEHVTTSLKVDGISEVAKKVLGSLIPVTREVESRDGRWYSMRVHPYRTTDNAIAGVVVTFVDITEETQLHEQLEYARAIIGTLREPFLVLDGDLRVVSANNAFYQSFRVQQKNTEGKLVYELGNRQWDIPALRKLLEEILPKNTFFENFPMEHDFPGIGHRRMLLNARQLQSPLGEDKKILLAMEDVTDKAKVDPA